MIPIDALVVKTQILLDRAGFRTVNQSSWAVLSRQVLEAITGMKRILTQTSCGVYPQPPKTFTSYRIPRPLNQSLVEADRAFQAGANIAACMMLGRALEALYRDLLQPKSETPETGALSKTKRPIMLGAGIKDAQREKDN